MASRNFDKRIIRILKNASAMSEEDLALVIDAAKAEQAPVSTILVKKGLFEENDLLGLLAERLRVTPISLPDCMLDPAIVRIIPQEVATGHHLVPISRIEDILTIAVSNPFDVVTLILVAAFGKMGHVAKGLRALDEAFADVQQTGERWLEAELHRLKGELLLQQSSDNQTEAESCFHQALAVAQNQHAKSWELRTATSLARLWQSQDKRQDAYDLLASVYNWFTEGFDTADLQDAQSLLEELETKNQSVGE